LSAVSWRARAFFVSSAERHAESPTSQARQAGQAGQADGKASLPSRASLPSPTSLPSQAGRQGQAKPNGKPSRKRASPTSRLEARLSPIKPLPYQSTASPGRAQRNPARAQERASPAKPARRLAPFAGQAGRATPGQSRNAQGRHGRLCLSSGFLRGFPPVSTRFPPGRDHLQAQSQARYRRTVIIAGARLIHYGRAVNCGRGRLPLWTRP